MKMTDKDKLIEELTGALRFILAFYEPNQRYLDTEAWKQAEAGGRRALAKGEEALKAGAEAAEDARLKAARNAIEAEQASISGIDGYNYVSGHEYGLRRALIILDAALTPVPSTD